MLAPLLFLFYINTLTERLPDDVVYSLFADDISLLSTGSSLTSAKNNLQQSINIVTQWAKEYKMELSDKSEVCYFSTSAHEASWIPTVKMNNNLVRFNPSPRLLGVYLDRTLSFQKQVEEVKNKVTAKCRMLAALANSKWGGENQN